MQIVKIVTDVHGKIQNLTKFSQPSHFEGTIPIQKDAHKGIYLPLLWPADSVRLLKKLGDSKMVTINFFKHQTSSRLKSL